MTAHLIQQKERIKRCQISNEGHGTNETDEHTQSTGSTQPNTNVG